MFPWDGGGEKGVPGCQLLIHLHLPRGLLLLMFIVYFNIVFFFLSFFFFFS